MTILCRGLSYSFANRVHPVLALCGVDLEISQGEFVILCGSAGSGKTTLLRLIGGILPVQQGRLQVLGVELNSLTSRQLLELRRRIGFVFHGDQLIESLSAADNVAVGLRYQGMSARERRHRVLEMLSVVGLEQRQSLRPGQLGGGERQRLAIARAFAASPQLILADEPTSSLSWDRAQAILGLFLRQVQERNSTILMTTHDHRLLEYADRIILLEDGRIVANTPVGASLAEESTIPCVPSLPANRLATPSAPAGETSSSNEAEGRAHQARHPAEQDRERSDPV